MHRVCRCVRNGEDVCVYVWVCVCVGRLFAPARTRSRHQAVGGAVTSRDATPAAPPAARGAGHPIGRAVAIPLNRSLLLHTFHANRAHPQEHVDSRVHIHRGVRSIKLPTNALLAISSVTRHAVRYVEGDRMSPHQRSVTAGGVFIDDYGKIAHEIYINSQSCPKDGTGPWRYKCSPLTVLAGSEPVPRDYLPTSFHGVRRLSSRRALLRGQRAGSEIPKVKYWAGATRGHVAQLELSRSTRTMRSE
ncbi:hypothetical protein EVAR_92854_1 [Eumeta japonica]|uniref:Uncharacterized protein n=1 Tax=Eumeta variegata TaxID=151549 RepID=A0A4C1T9Y0_EUMVA|nr:hypothetical protein EVAR_92854_1 [Eumeta japonica]